MLLLAPHIFRPELTRADQTKLDDLRDTGILLHSQGAAPSAIQAKLVEDGWSRAFSDWYVSQIGLSGPDLELRITRESEYESSLAAYRRSFKLKTSLTRSGWLLVLSAVILRVVFEMLASDALATKNGGLALLSLLVWPVSVVLWFKGLWNVLDAKNQTRWWSLIGVFILLVPDRNPLFEPRDPARHGQDAAILHDW